jgi:hypothetical protein
MEMKQANPKRFQICWRTQQSHLYGGLLCSTHHWRFICVHACGYVFGPLFCGRDEILVISCNLHNRYDDVWLVVHFSSHAIRRHLKNQSSPVILMNELKAQGMRLVANSQPRDVHQIISAAFVWAKYYARLGSSWKSLMLARFKNELL